MADARARASLEEIQLEKKRGTSRSGDATLNLDTSWSQLEACLLALHLHCTFTAESAPDTCKFAVRAFMCDGTMPLIDAP